MAREKFQIPSTKFQTITKISMTQTSNYDLEERTFQFAKNVALCVNSLPKTVVNIEYIRQVIRSSGSIGANYIEANESLSKKDFLMRIKISRKENKESMYWLRLLKNTNPVSYALEFDNLLQEALELRNIFSSIIVKCENPRI